MTPESPQHRLELVIKTELRAHLKSCLELLQSEAAGNDNIAYMEEYADAILRLARELRDKRYDESSDAELE